MTGLEDVSKPSDPSTPALPTTSVIVLTMGDRQQQLQALVGSLGTSTFEGILIGNGFEPEPLANWSVHYQPNNLGVPGGRAEGARRAAGEVLIFLDDDAVVRTPDLVERVAHAFAADPHLGALAMRITVTGTDVSLRQWQPRVRGRRPLTPGEVTSFPGGAHAIRTDAYQRVGGYESSFFFSHEETDLSWRLLDDGWRIVYEPDLVVEHPRVEPSGHRTTLWHSARNRVWLARRHLPVVLAVGYVAFWSILQLARNYRSASAMRSIVVGTYRGLRDPISRRSPLSWSTVIKMTKLGRPPLF